MIAEIVNGNLVQKNSLLEALQLTGIQAPRIAAAGAGGKTTTLKRLAAEYMETGQKPIVITTTHMFREDSPFFLEDPSAEDILALLEQKGCVFAGGKAPGGKIKQLPKEVLDRVLDLPNPVLIEADGAKRLPVKFPAEQEPVLLPQTTHVLYLFGMDALLGAIHEVCFRPELAAAFLKKTPADRLTLQDMAVLAQSGQAGRKGVESGMDYTVIFNQADTFQRRSAAAQIRKSMHHPPRVIVSGRGTADGSVFRPGKDIKQDKRADQGMKMND